MKINSKLSIFFIYGLPILLLLIPVFGLVIKKKLDNQLMLSFISFFSYSLFFMWLHRNHYMCEIKGEEIIFKKLFDKISINKSKILNYRYEIGIGSLALHIFEVLTLGNFKKTIKVFGKDKFVFDDISEKNKIEHWLKEK